MPDPGRLSLFTIPAHRAFGDCLAAGLIERAGGDALRLARGTVLLPNNRAKRALTQAFVRASGGGLLLPRLVSIANFGDDIVDMVPDGAARVPAAVAPLHRRLIIARLIERERARAGVPVDAAEAVRLAGDLTATLDQLLVEAIDPAALGAIDPGGELSEHWQRALALFTAVVERWQNELATLGRIDHAERRNRILTAASNRWRDAVPAGFVCAAGITDPAPSVAGLLRTVAGLRDGMVVVADLALTMAEDEWEALGPHQDAPDAPRRGSIETHPQFHLKLLLDRMGVQRGEFASWPGTDPSDTRPRRRSVAIAMAPAAFTGRWTALDLAARQLTGVTPVECATPAEEAQVIALALRQALETSGRTAALVTPDRALARRVVALCRRWDIEIDDSAGRPLSILPPGVLIIALADAATQCFAPVALLALLKHPLVRSGAARIDWLDGVRALDRVLRGPRPAAGLGGLSAHLAANDQSRRAADRKLVQSWWPAVQALLTGVEELFGSADATLAELLAGLRAAAAALCGEELWSGPAGRAAADLFTELERYAGSGPTIEPAALAPLLRTLMDEVAVRPLQGGHPRLAIYGLIEARLQGADLMILGGLNEGVWPGAAAPEPWLAPRIRRELGLAGLDRGVGMAAHDLVAAMGAPLVLLTRSRRDARSPTLPSRFWLRLKALAGERFDPGHAIGERLDPSCALGGWARRLDDPGRPVPAVRPKPVPATADRPKRIAVTDLDLLTADPFSFYAKRLLRLTPLDPVDADPSPAWRGTAVHAVLEQWARGGSDATASLIADADAMLAGAAIHPLMRALWWPRLRESIGWIGDEIAGLKLLGRDILDVERGGEIDIADVTLTGKFDRVDRDAGGQFIVVDYKTGPPPRPDLDAGFGLQLGLLGLMIERGAFAGLEGPVEAFEYWSLARKGDRLGNVNSPVDPARKRGKPDAAGFLARAEEVLRDAADRWLTGAAPFEAKRNPVFARHGDYDQLMRRDEWYGRGR